MLTACGNGSTEEAEDQVESDAVEPAANGEENGQEDGAAEEAEGDAAEAAEFTTPACDLLSASELEAILGLDFQDGEQPEDLTMDDECRFERDTDEMDEIGLASLSIFATHTYSDEEDQWEQLREEAEGLIEIDGVALDAFVEEGDGLFDGDINIRVEGAWLTVSEMDIDGWADHYEEIAQAVDANL